jgi:hypothetical protein
LTFGSGQHKDPHEVGPRRLLAKTCLGCGLLLDASWFAARDTGRKWATRCNRCHGQTYRPKVTTHAKDGGKSARRVYERLQAVSREYAVNHGQPWLDKDHEVLRNSELTAIEKSIRLGRTYAATHVAVKVNGYVSRVGRVAPEKGQWRIDNPNAEAMRLSDDREEAA